MSFETACLCDAKRIDFSNIKIIIHTIKQRNLGWEWPIYYSHMQQGFIEVPSAMPQPKLVDPLDQGPAWTGPGTRSSVAVAGCGQRRSRRCTPGEGYWTPRRPSGRGVQSQKGSCGQPAHRPAPLQTTQAASDRRGHGWAQAWR